MDETAISITATQLWLYAVQKFGQIPLSMPHMGLTAVDTLVVMAKGNAQCPFDPFSL